MKIAIISDIHGNYQALKSVLEDIKARNVDKIFCLGDILGKGVNANKCVNLIKKNCEVVVRGNTDVRFTSDENDFIDNPIEYNRIVFNKSLLSNENIEYIKNLPFAYEFYLSGNLIRIFHATPFSEFGFINDWDTNIPEKYQIFVGTEKTPTTRVSDIAIYGHLHYPFMTRMYNKIMLGAGSVGCSACPLYDEKLNSNANEINQAHYLILDGKFNSKEKADISFEFESVCYDIEKELADNIGVNPEYESYAEELGLGKYRNLPKIKEAFEKNGYQFGEE